METEQQQLQKTPSTIYFVEEMKPEYVEYIDSCKIRAQTDSEYWQTLKDSMSRGMIQLDSDDKSITDDDKSIEDNISEDNVSADDVSIETMRSLLEYQIKMLENMNYAIDMLTEKCDELTKYCAKLASRLKKYNVSQPSMVDVKSATVDVNGITNNNDAVNSTTIPVKETFKPSIPLQMNQHVHNDEDTIKNEDDVNDDEDNDSLEESTHDVETVEV